ncbi:MAG: hypothetical protein HQM03_06845 [Magnetococcales bacterium]|nr:hypothetical protein [Magnetococcales bacterium]
MKKISLEPGEWVVAGGLLLLLAGILVALFADALSGNPPAPDVALAGQTVGVPPGVDPILDNAGDGLRMIPVAATRPVDPGGTTALVQLTQAPRLTFGGKIHQISEQPQTDGQLHVWLQDPKQGELRVSVGPGWFLKYLGCSLRHDAQMDGAGFRYDGQGGQGPALVYARRIRIDGKDCQLRNDEGFALWSNKLQ